MRERYENMKIYDESLSSVVCAFVCTRKSAWLLKIVYYIWVGHTICTCTRDFSSSTYRKEKKGILCGLAVDTETNTTFEKSFNITHIHI